MVHYPNSNEMELIAYAPSLDECLKHNAKFPSLSVKKVTEKAKDEGAYTPILEEFEGNGYFNTRTADDWSASMMLFVDFNGTIVACSSSNSNAGACFGMSLVYDPESKIVKNATKRNFTRVIFNRNKNAKEEVTDKDVPIVKVGDFEYIWYNKEECESGKNPLMDILILDMPACAKPVDRYGRTDDYSFAVRQHEHYERIALQGTSAEERKLIVTMKFLKSDMYEQATPVYTKEQEEIIERVKASFEPQN